MKKFKGIVISSGIGIGKAQIILPQELVIDDKSILRTDVQAEIERFEESLDHSLSEIDHLIENFAQTKNNQKILRTHKMLLTDPDFIQKIKKLISEDFYNLEKAVDQHFREVIEFFGKMDNEYMSERSNDFKDVANRLLAHITKQGYDHFKDLKSDNVLIMKEITPSEITKLFDKKIGGLITEKGSKTAHSSILARSIGLPAVSAIAGIANQIKPDQLVIVDGYKGEILVDPEPQVLEMYKKLADMDEEKRVKLLKIIGQEVKTIDGKKIRLKCNIEIPEEMPQVQKLNPDGIGLMRTEFIFIDRGELPNEEEQFNIYKKIAEQMGEKEVIIRTIDVGGDKLSKVLNLAKEQNPNLGCRGIRISLLYPEIFKVQLRAILRANKFGNIALMFPMVSSIQEIRSAKAIMQECIEELRSEEIEFDAKLKVGIMIEIPSAAICSDIFAAECDFFSIGTNDLIQYTLAVDRGNEHVNEYYQPLHPAVLRLISTTVQNGHDNGINVSVCGEMASDLECLDLLIGMGVDELSVSPGRFLKVKEKIINMHFSEAKKITEQLFRIGNFNN